MGPAERTGERDRPSARRSTEDREIAQQHELSPLGVLSGSPELELMAPQDAEHAEEGPSESATQARRRAPLPRQTGLQ